MPVFHLDEDAPERRVTPINSSERQVAAFRDELTGFYSEMQNFGSMDLGQILMDLAAMSARAAEIRFQLIIGEDRRLSTFRTKQLDPFLEEVDRQFRIWSRVQTIRQQEWDMSKAGV